MDIRDNEFIESKGSKHFLQELVCLSIPMMCSRGVCQLVNRYVKVCVLQVHRRCPHALFEEWNDDVESLHPEAFGFKTLGLAAGGWRLAYRTYLFFFGVRKNDDRKRFPPFPLSSLPRPCLVRPGFLSPWRCVGPGPRGWSGSPSSTFWR